MSRRDPGNPVESKRVSHRSETLARFAEALALVLKRREEELDLDRIRGDRRGNG